MVIKVRLVYKKYLASLHQMGVTVHTNRHIRYALGLHKIQKTEINISGIISGFFFFLCCLFVINSVLLETNEIESSPTHKGFYSMVIIDFFILFDFFFFFVYNVCLFLLRIDNIVP